MQNPLDSSSTPGVNAEGRYKVIHSPVRGLEKKLNKAAAEGWEVLHFTAAADHPRVQNGDAQPEEAQFVVVMQRRQQG